MEQHSVYSPSRLARILRCPGSVQMCTKVPQEGSSPYAEEGTLLHEVTRECLIHDKTPLQVKADLTKEQANAVQDCLDFYRLQVVAMGDDSYSLLIEQAVNCLPYGVPEVHGTVDLVIHNHVKKEVRVIDWKFGQGVPVYASENEQILAYAAGYAGPEWIREHTFILYVVQPRIDSYTSYTISGNELFDWAVNTLADGIRAAKQPNAKLVPGEKQCRWCNVKAQCRARLENAHKIAADVFKAYTDIKADGSLVSDEELAKLLVRAGELDSYISALNAYAQQKLTDTGSFPMHKLVASRSSRGWAYTEDIVVRKLDELGVPFDDIYTSKLASPPQIETACKHLKRDPEFQGLYVKAPGKPTMVLDTDPRPALHTSNRAETAFSGLME